MVSLPLSTYRKSRAKCKCSLTYIIAFFDMRSNLKVGSFARKSGFSAPVGGKKSYNLSKLGLHSSLKQWVGCDPWLYTHTHTQNTFHLASLHNSLLPHATHLIHLISMSTDIQLKSTSMARCYIQSISGDPSHLKCRLRMQNIYT